jgi:hypothetical protein
MCNKPYDKEHFPKDIYNFCKTCATNREPFHFSTKKYGAPMDQEVKPTYKQCFGCLKTFRHSKSDFCAECNSKTPEEVGRIRSKALLAKQDSASHKAASPKAASPKAASPKVSPRHQAKK